ncbi:immediate early protein 1 [Anticarsia gemmatalis multiple nucleopolyhedrovirus]|uniref:Immediate early protein 1 n=1 Tax=Anticarsia gemmatalis multiple nucleopolyhedrovirus TaxID=268591 RepID=A0A0S3J1I2_9ABAC|nr:immediate early protein 1 [Anticarsia gemmatalis multiple nucleopolyhedrovirus]ALR71550.1 immediate early protein 1 [Anticarsia gemmatalis multiple nucleopolyhedrovirus]
MKRIDNYRRSYVTPSTPSHALFNATEVPIDVMVNSPAAETNWENISLTENMSLTEFDPPIGKEDLETMLQTPCDNLTTLENASQVLANDVGSSLLSEYLSFNPRAMEPEVQLSEPSTSGTKRKASEDIDVDSDDDFRGKKHVNKNKIRPRYKKATVQNHTTLQEEQRYTTEICTVAPAKQIAQYFSQDFSVYLDKLDCQMSANRFSDHISETGYYVFVVKKSEVKPFEVVFAKFVNNVTNEYQNNYYMVDNRVFVVSLNNVKFMVSYKLVRDQGIEIPPHVNLCNDSEAASKPYDCYFEPVKNAFQATLIKHFHLDMYYAQTTFVTLMQSLGENKTGMLLGKLYQMYQDRSLFTLPIMLSRKEPIVENTPLSRNYMSSYVSQIIKYSKNIQFPQGEPNQDIIDRLEQIVTLKSPLTYKYSSVANLLFNKYNHQRDNNADNLKKVKKEDGNRLLVEQYMSQNESDVTSHNFIVLSFGSNDERLTIAKKANEYYWIAGEIKDINVDDMIKKYTKNVHHVFRIIKVNRRESTTWHNNLLKMLALLLQNLINIEDAKQLSEKSDSKFSYKQI